MAGDGDPASGGVVGGVGRSSRPPKKHGKGAWTAVIAVGAASLAGLYTIFSAVTHLVPPFNGKPHSVSVPQDPAASRRAAQGAAPSSSQATSPSAIATPTPTRSVRVSPTPRRSTVRPSPPSQSVRPSPPAQEEARASEGEVWHFGYAADHTHVGANKVTLRADAAGNAGVTFHTGAFHRLPTNGEYVTFETSMTLTGSGSSARIQVVGQQPDSNGKLQPSGKAIVIEAQGGYVHFGVVDNTSQQPTDMKVPLSSLGRSFVVRIGATSGTDHRDAFISVGSRQIFAGDLPRDWDATVQALNTHIGPGRATLTTPTQFAITRDREPASITTQALVGGPQLVFSAAMS